MLIRAPKKVEEHESEILMTSYRNLNDFLCAFIDHSLPKYNYTIRDRYFIEKILNYEFQVPTPVGLDEQVDSIFFVGKFNKINKNRNLILIFFVQDNERNFTRAMFAGHENSLFIWNMATFLFIDYFAFNYVLAAVITYLINLVRMIFISNRKF